MSDFVVDPDALRDLLRDNPALVTALVAAPDVQPSSPLTYVGMARFYGYARHERTGVLASNGLSTPVESAPVAPVDSPPW